MIKQIWQQIIKGYDKTFSLYSSEAAFNTAVILLLVFFTGIIILAFSFISFTMSMSTIRALLITLLPLPIFLYYIGGDKGN
jgi:uncharacterized membrane protein